MDKKEQFEEILKQYPWPEKIPDRDYFMHGWLSVENKQNLKGLLNNIENPLVVEIGTWLGMSAKFMLDLNPELRIITVDTFEGSKEHFENPEWKAIFDMGLEGQAIRNLWEYKNRCCIYKADSLRALHVLYLDNIKPDLIYIDGAHEFFEVYREIEMSISLFKSSVCGDDAVWPSVQKALDTIEEKENISGIYQNDSFWRIVK